VTTVLVVAPHPDDETLGCGGTLLRHRAEGDAVHWLVATSMTEDGGYAPERIHARQAEIRDVAEGYGFASVVQLGLPTARIDTLGAAKTVHAMAVALGRLNPEVLYVPFAGDAHSDHRDVFAAVAATAKWFRCPSVRRILAYETLSETDAALLAGGRGFEPNVFVDVTPWLDEKVRLMSRYSGEMRQFPFPRSVDAIRALARVRGAASGFEAAEAFVLVRERR